MLFEYDGQRKPIKDYGMNVLSYKSIKILVYKLYHFAFEFTIFFYILESP